MSKVHCDEEHFEVLMPQFASYCETIDSIYRLKTDADDELIKIYQTIENNLIQTKLFSPDDIISVLLVALRFNNRFVMSYYSIYQQIIDAHKNQIFNKQQVSFFNNIKSDFDSLIDQDLKQLSEAILSDDIELFISYTQRVGFDINKQFSNKLFPSSANSYSLIELCCYYGAVGCFKFLRSELDEEISPACLQLSFLSGKPDIMNECLKYQTPDEICMEYAIASHNIDFISFLMNEYDLSINVEFCGKYNNLHAFLIYLDQTNDINECFIYSPIFRIPSLCEYFLSKNVKINVKGYKDNRTALHNAALCNCPKIMELLLTHNAKVNIKSKNKKTPLHYAAQKNNLESVIYLIDHGAKIDSKAYFAETPLHYAALKNCLETVKVLISLGANINAKTVNNITAISLAAQNNNK